MSHSIHSLRRVCALYILPRSFSILLALFALASLLLITHASTAYASGTITGKVFQDFDGDGNFDTTVATGVAVDLQVAGVTVTAYDSAGANQGSTTSVVCTAASTPIATCTGANAGSNYSLSASGTGPYRIEFTWANSSGALDSFEHSANSTDSVNGGTATNSGSTVQFVPDGSTSNVNLAMARPCDHCQSSPTLVTDRFESGTGATGTTNATNASVVSMAYDPSTHTTAAQLQQTGSVWGVAYNGLTKRVFASAFLKRHVGLGPRSSSGVVDGVYVINFTGAPTVEGGFDLNTVAPVNGGAINLGTVDRTSDANHTLSATPTTATIDIDAFGKVGKVGFGDSDFGDDGKTLWLVNLNQRTLIKVDTSQVVFAASANNYLAPGAAVNHYEIVSNDAAIPDITSAPSCTNGSLRPFGLKIREKYGYLGVVCDAATSASVDNPPELIGYVLRFDVPNPTSFTTLVTIPMTYNREPYYQMQNTTNRVDGQWQRWMNTWTDAEVNTPATAGCCGSFRSAPSPIVSDIEFMPDGSLVIGVMDRFSHQSGWANRKALAGDATVLQYGSVGDILLAKWNGISFTLELGETDPTDPYPDGADGFPEPEAGYRGDDSPGNAGELFYGDAFKGSDASHHETSLGGIGIAPGTDQVTITAFDPNGFFRQGLIWLSATSGAKVDSYAVTTGTGLQTFGKANGMGDLEFLCEAAPIEIGNRVWKDNNGDGIQGPDEPPIANVTVELRDSGNALVASAVTSLNGEYYFSSASGSNTTSSIFGLTINYGANYTVRIDPTAGSNPAQLSGLALTTQDAAQPANGNASATNNNSITDVADSDSASSAGMYAIPFTTGNEGTNNNSFDFGFSPAATVDYGDLPDTGAGTGAGNYQTLDSDGGPYHIITSGLNIGAPDVVDAETGTLQNAAADADDTSNTGYADDEEGVATFPTFTPGQAASVDVTVNNPSGGIGAATLYGFIDWNNDGDFNDTGEAVSVAVPDNTVGTVSLNFNVPASASSGANVGARFRLTTDTLTLNNAGAIGAASDGEVEDYIVTIASVPVDYGDLPDTGAGTGAGNYQTLDSDGGPYHIITSGLNIGAPDVVDAETGTLQNAAADADDTSNTGYADDEEGVATFPTFTPGQAASVDVTVNNPSGGIGAATLYGFIDWNNDGDFNDTGEAVSVAVPDNTVGTVSLNFNVPASAASGSNVGARFRLTTDTLTLNNAGAIGAASDGEVEDYIVTIASVPVDYGDLPDTGAGTGAGNYQTLDSDGGPYHIITSGLNIGAADVVDAETGTLQNAAADADDTSNTGYADDEEGVATFPTFTPGQAASVDVTVNNPSGGIGAATLYGFIDWNNDGDFNDTGEAVSVAVPDNTVGAVTLNFSVPASASSGANVGARFRLTTDTLTLNNAGAIGAASDGEVEDYIVTIATAYDYGDLPDTGAGTGAGNYQTLDSDGGPSHIITSGLNLGAPDVVDAETGLLQNAAATADDGSNTGFADDEDGIATFPTFIPGQVATVNITVNNPSGGIGAATLYGFIDWNNDGDFNEPGEVVSVAIPDNTVGAVTLNVSVPAGATTGVNLGARFRLTTDTLTLDNNGAIGAASDGEVEDYIVTVVGEDYGDLPDTGAGTGAGNYQTLATDNGPSHLITAGLNIGAPNVVDSETGLLQNAAATADDGSNTGFTDDEEGIASFPNFILGQAAAVNVTVNNPSGGIGAATLYGFIDWNGDGDFGDTGEAVSVAVPDNTVGTAMLNFNVPLGAATGVNLGARFRLTTDTLTLDNNGAVGSASDGEVEDYIITVSQHGAIGNRVWIDEDSNGYQDEGEDGIPNVTVQLKDSGGAVIATLLTDSNANYLFTGLPAGTYSVQVLGSTIPSGMTQTTIYPNAGADFFNQNQSVGDGYGIVLGSGETNLTADFGYNWNPTNNVNNGGPANTTAALGDRVWIDTNGNGRQDDAEIGVSGAIVTLYGSPGPDGVWGNLDDVTYTTGGYVPDRVTDANGFYMFDNLPPGQYLVRVNNSATASHNVLGGQFTQTGDPDHYGTTGFLNDQQTTVPVILGPGDVFLDADFGYQPGGFSGTPPLGSIGNFVWYDRDADGVGPTAGGEPHGAAPGTDNTEFGLAGVTVALIRDLDGDGVWDAGEPIIATTHTSDGTEDVDNDGATDYVGYYNFRGLPVTDGVGTDDYLVWVNDTNHVLDGLRATYDFNGASPVTGLATGLGISSVADLTTTAVINQDFGYTDDEVLDTPTNSGVLGDRVWLDIDGDGVQDAGEPGIPGVTVNLYDSTGTTLLATTTTGANGLYLFPNLPTSAGGITYVVRVDPTTLPGGLAQTFDFSGGLDNESTRTLTDASPIQLDQDFGYRGLGTIGNLVWNDVNADGNRDAGELGIGGVTLDLYYDANGNGLVDAGEIKLGTTTTNGSGGYLFSGLPTDDGGGNAQYIVDVTDTAGVLSGFWHSLDSNPNNTTDTAGAETTAVSHNDPVPVTLTTAVPNNRNADFGYYLIPGAVGNYVWYDTDADGVQDGTELGINGATVVLTLRYPGANGTLGDGDDTISTISTVTMTEPGGVRDGWYSFGNLLQDEDYNGYATYGTEPSHTISLTMPANYAGSPLGNGTPTTDSNDPTGTTAQPFKGQTNTLFANDSAPISSYDFGIYRLSLTGTVWVDSDKDGVLGGSEPRSTGLTVNLYLDANNDNIPDGPAIATTTTDINGEYFFEGLSSSARYMVGVQPGAGWSSTLDIADPSDTSSPAGMDNNDNGVGKNTNGAEIFSHSFVFTAGTLIGGNNVGNAIANGTATTRNDRVDFGIVAGTTATDVSNLNADVTPENTVHLTWSTLTEANIGGFNVQRSETHDGSYSNLNANFIPATAPGTDLTNAYEYTDTNVVVGNTYYYRIEILRLDSTTETTTPTEVTVGTAPCNGKTAAPVLLTPANDAKLEHGKVTLTWNAVDCAKRYVVQIREGSSDGATVVNKKKVKTTEFSVKKLQGGTTYFWRVLSCNAASKCTTSEWWSFKIKKE